MDVPPPTAVTTMAINMAVQGVPDSLGIMIPFLVLTVFNMLAGVFLLRNVREELIPQKKSKMNLFTNPKGV